jgi:low affinity Fe/Cu permease
LREPRDARFSQKINISIQVRSAIKVEAFSRLRSCVCSLCYRCFILSIGHDMEKSKHGGFFRKFSQATAHLVGTPGSFFLAVAVVVIWAVSGPFFHFSDTWQLVINTGTTIVTFLMVFLIQNTQNRDSKAIHIKLDELLSSLKEARDKVIDIEDSSDEEIERVSQEFQHLHKRLDGEEPGKR